MIKEIKILDVYTVRETVAAKHDYDVLMSLYDDEYKQDIEHISVSNKSSGNTSTHFTQYFCDIDEMWINPELGVLTEEGFSNYCDATKSWYQDGPGYKNVSEIIKFGRNLINSTTEHKVLLHCHAGVSRSTATGIILTYLKVKDEQQAIKNIFDIRQCMWPNQLMLRIADDILGSNLYPAILEWKAKESEKPFSGFGD